MKPEDRATTRAGSCPRHVEQYVSTFSRAYMAYPCRLMYSLISPTRLAKIRSRSKNGTARHSARRAPTVLLPDPPGTTSRTVTDVDRYSALSAPIGSTPAAR